MLWDAFTSASYQSLGKEALSGWKKKKHIFHPNCLAERKFRARSLPAVAWCWSLPQHERGCGDTHLWGRCHRMSQGHPAATSGRGSAWPRRLERGFVGIFHAPPRRKGWGWVWGCIRCSRPPWKRIQGTWGVLLGGSTKPNPNAEAHRAGDGRELGTWQGRAQKAKGIDLL